MSGVTANKVSVDLIGYCALCLKLRQPIERDQVQDDSSVFNPTLNSFSHLWDETKDVEGKISLIGFRFVTGDLGNGNSTSSVPPVCGSCRDVLYKGDCLYRDLIKIKKKLEEYNNLVQNILGKSCDQVSEFEERLLSSNADKSSWKSTIEFVQALRKTKGGLGGTKLLKEKIAEKLKKSHQLPKNDCDKQGSPASNTVALSVTTSNALPDSPDTEIDFCDDEMDFDTSLLVQRETEQCEEKTKNSKTFQMSREKSGFLQIIRSKPKTATDMVKEDSRTKTTNPLKSISTPIVKKSFVAVANKINVKKRPPPTESSDSESESDTSSTSTESASEPEVMILSDKPAKPKRLSISKSIKEIPSQYRVIPGGRLPVSKKRIKIKVGPTQFCEFCRARISINKIQEHLCTHVSSEYIKQCPNNNCKYYFVSPRLLHKHTRNKCSNKDKTKFLVKKCDTCAFETVSLLAFVVHLGRHETLTKPFTCPYTSCLETFSVFQSVLQHLDKHVYLAPIIKQACPSCREFVIIAKMKNHLKEKHNVEEYFQCKECPKIFLERKNLINHLRVHLDVGVSCDICDDVKYSRLLPLREHYSTVHKICDMVTCDCCKAEFFTEESLKLHKQIKHRPTSTTIVKARPPKIFKCEICFDSVEFKCEDTLVRHNIEIHGAEPYCCQTCKLTFTDRLKFRRHEKQHAGLNVYLKQHKCDHCGKVFRGPKKLKLHMKIQHSQGPVEFEHICSTCGKGYHIRADLHHHTKVAHEGFRYICHICGDSFTETGSLKRHQLVHSGERPFSCDFCGQLFRHRETLSTHLKSHQEKGDRFQPKGPMKERRSVRGKRIPN